MKKIILLLSLCLIYACNQKKNEKTFDYNKLYREYFRVVHVYDSLSGEDVLKYDYTPLDSIERATLLEILIESGMRYKVCVDSTILVSTISLPDENVMAAIQDELGIKVKKKLRGKKD